MKLTSKIIIPVTLLVVAIGGTFWLGSSNDTTRPQHTADKPTKTTDRAVATTFNSAAQDRIHVTSAPGAGAEVSSARKVFADTSQPLSARFTDLVTLAIEGDTSAAHLAVQIANHCNAFSRVPVDQPPLGHSHATTYQIQLRREVQSKCATVLNAPKFSDLKNWLKKHPVDALDKPLEAAVRHYYANGGSQAALRAAVGAVVARPDETTALAVAGQLTDLDMSSLYAQPELQFMDSLKPAQRATVLRFAFELLACHYGRPCGPDSMAVHASCFALAACIPGADLETLYEKRLLNPQQAKQVNALTAYLRQVPGIPVIQRRI